MKLAPLISQPTKVWSQLAAVVCSKMEDLGDISAVPAGRSVPMSCSDCRVTWRGCADVFECPRCGAPQRFWQDHEDPGEVATVERPQTRGGESCR
jgi:hypothetical protein